MRRSLGSLEDAMQQVLSSRQASSTTAHAKLATATHLRPAPTFGTSPAVPDKRHQRAGLSNNPPRTAPELTAMQSVPLRSPPMLAATRMTRLDRLASPKKLPPAESLMRPEVAGSPTPQSHTPLPFFSVPFAMLKAIVARESSPYNMHRP